jgi:hypothetical protein
MTTFTDRTRSLDLCPPSALSAELPSASVDWPQRVRRQDRLGGLMHEYTLPRDGMDCGNPTGIHRRVLKPLTPDQVKRLLSMTRQSSW